MSFEDEYVKRPKARNPLTPYYPVIGLLLAGALGAIAYVLSSPATDWLRDHMDSFPEGQEVEYVVAGAMFFIFILFAGLIYAMFVPKQGYRVTEKEMKQEKDRREKERMATKKRKQEVNRKMARERTEAAKQNKR